MVREETKLNKKRFIVKDCGYVLTIDAKLTNPTKWELLLK